MLQKSKKIHCGLVGCGRISQRHLEALKAIPEVAVVALCDNNQERLQKASLGIPGARLFTDYDEMLKCADIDFVSICTPSGLHAAMAIAAAKAGKHAILEKPMALTISDAERTVLTFEKEKKELCVVLQNRCNPAVVFLREQMSHLGQLRYATTSVFWNRDQAYYDDGWHGSRALDGGVLMNQATHYVDMLLYLVGKRVTRISAFGGTYAHRMECEDAATVNLQFDDGTVANIQANSFSYPENYEGSITLFFEKATVKIGGKALNRIEYWRGEKEKEATLMREGAFSHIYGEGHRIVIENFVDRLLGKGDLLISGSEGIKSLRIILGAYESLEKEKTITI